jgi:hypothetical protein
VSNTDRKKKMISLRLSEVEYEELKAHYRAYGVRNVSELARLALQQIRAGLAGPQDGFAANAKLSELDERLHQVESHVSLLLEREKSM